MKALLVHGDMHVRARGGGKNGDGYSELMRGRWRRCLDGEGEGKEEAVDVYV